MEVPKNKYSQGSEVEMRQVLLGITSDRGGLTYGDILEALGQWLEVIFPSSPSEPETRLKCIDIFQRNLHHSAAKPGGALVGYTPL